VSAAPSLLQLADGRHLAWAEYGDPQGRPVLYCHGYPGSRLEAQLAAAAAQRLGVRLIAPDRPGLGASDPLPGRRLVDWPDDIAALADHLGLGRLHLVGVSGGGPYVLACAARLAPRLAAVALVCGLGELAAPAAAQGMAWPLRQGVQLYQHLPGVADWLFGHVAGPLLQAHPEALQQLMARQLPPADQAVLDDPQVYAALQASFAAAFEQGAAGPAWEAAIYQQPWAIEPQRIGVPVQLWHGELDNIVPVAMGRRHAALLPNCRARFLPGEGHFSLLVRHMDAILGQLLGG
jgi:pimeloyl-ACP methyl ester carboxylesterase